MADLPGVCVSGAVVRAVFGASGKAWCQRSIEGMPRATAATGLCSRLHPEVIEQYSDQSSLHSRGGLAPEQFPKSTPSPSMISVRLCMWRCRDACLRAACAGVMPTRRLRSRRSRTPNTSSRGPSGSSPTRKQATACTFATRVRLDQE